MKEVFNFCAGPAMLPKEVMEKAQSEFTNWRDLGCSVMEVSHRGKDFIEIAAKAAFREAVKSASPILLEPMMSIEITTPQQYTGDLIGHINSIRGSVVSLDAEKSTNVVRAIAPLSNMFGYVNTLRTMSSGRAQYTMQFDSYEKIPTHIAEKIIDNLK